MVGDEARGRGGGVNAGVTASVVVCVYTLERWDDITAALASLRRQERRPDEVVVVVDHNDELARRLGAHYPELRIVRNAHAKGLSGARNTGVQSTRGDVVVFLDDDAVATPGWLAALVDPFADHDVIAVGGRVAPAWDRGRPSWFPEEFDWVVGCSYRGQPSVTAAVRNVLGGNMGWRRHVFDRVGWFREEIGRVGTHPMGCEETELCIRALQAMPGSRVILEPAALIHHRVTAGRSTWSYFRRRCYAEGYSKALVTDAVGHRDGLATERAYSTRTLPSGVARHLADAVGERRLAGVRRSGAIVAGLAVTTAGYARGRWGGRS